MKFPFTLISIYLMILIGCDNSTENEPQEVIKFSPTNWSKDPINPIILPEGDGQSSSLWYNSVLKKDGTFKMWYQGTSSSGGSSAQIFLATSEDGITWNKHPDPVLSFGDSGSFDVRAVQSPYVIFHDNIFKMWYSGIHESGGLRVQIGYAESFDGIEWQKHGVDPVIGFGDPGDFDSALLFRPVVLVDDNLFKMWYRGSSDDGEVTIGYATSFDGVNWNKYTGNPVVSLGEPGAFDDLTVWVGDIIQQNGIYHLWYGAANTDLIKSIGYASSPDGLNWTKYKDNPILTPEEPWESARLLGGAVHYSQEDGFTMWYVGGPIGVGAAIGVAYSNTIDAENGI